MGLNEVNKKKLDKKMRELQNAQIIDRAKHIERRNLLKEGDVNWQKYVKKQLAWLDKYYAVELRRYHAMMYRAYLDDQKGKTPSPNINL